MVSMTLLTSMSRARDTSLDEALRTRSVLWWLVQTPRSFWQTKFPYLCVTKSGKLDLTSRNMRFASPEMPLASTRCRYLDPCAWDGRDHWSWSTGEWIWVELLTAS